MNLNVVLRHELHALINRASADQLFTALHSPQSPIRDRFIKFLALSYADWLSTQNDIDDDDIKKEWKHALRMQPNGFAFNMINNQGDDYKADKSSADKPYTTSASLDTSEPNKSANLNGNHPSNVVVSNALGNGAGDSGMNGLNGNSHQLQLNEKMPMEGFKRLYTESEGELSQKLKQIITNDQHYNELIKSISPTDYNQSIMNDPDNNLLDQITGSNDTGSDKSNDISTPISIEQENMRKYFELLSADQQQLLKSKLPLLSDITTLDKRNEILIKKLQLCATTFDFLTTNPLELKGIEKKKQMLTEILEYIARYSWYNEQILERCIKTISGNLFRALPRSGKNPDVEDEPFEDPAWAHLQLIYDLTLRLVINTDVDKKTMKKYLEGEFVDNVIELFASEDPREREYLKTILHRIYGRFMPLRALIRQSIANCCYRTIYEQYTVNFDYHDDIIDYNNALIHNNGDYELDKTTFKYDNPNAIQKKVLKRMDKRYYQNSIRNENGIAEFLEIFCSIIHGFSIPVKKEHKDFLRNVLVPLHKCRKLEKFHEQLVACCVQFVFKDPSVAPVILGGLLKFWPIQSPTKEEMFIAEVVNVVNAMINHKNGFSWPENREICLSVIDTLVECMKSHHHSVAERALLVWGEDAIEILIDLDKKTIWPKIVEAFLDNKNHWNESLRECNEEAMDVFKVRDPQTFNRIREEYERKQKQTMSTAGGPSQQNQNSQNDAARQEAQQRRMEKWKKIKAMAQQKNASK
mmetsp:Transcript_6543/g.5783  ORF Transcript_6543/g.5783 Transcript_6543/m.5783 type:complete len:753 (-) Transcript_6543:268-2526(-)|eukprot:CAMPEP_0201567686 /NCGR_PEP_ID=MMETSP0190_2-20130828/8297_1 /ASSEMBLY_ACC=CAM_ASM_000263 /TAXON_ID=37353 /ORGANISM="Rosalina sp." /LENGTH=752 /DNA_ID=CAMNT_0047987975 /DNA_START=40 /DNA_END=2298 /DNA_ORIENTATION=+